MRAALAPREWGQARRLLRLARPERPLAFLVVALGLLSALFEAFALAMLVPLFEKFASPGGREISAPVIGPMVRLARDLAGNQAAGLILVILGLFLLGTAIGYLNMVVSALMSMSFSHRLRKQVFEAALSRHLTEIETLPPGKFLNTLATETWRTTDALSIVLGAIVQVATCAIFVGFLLALSPLYTAALAAMTLVTAAAVHLATEAVRRIGAAAVKANEAFMAYLWDALGGLRLVRGLGREPYERERFDDRSSLVRRCFTRLYLVSGIASPLAQALTVVLVGVLILMLIYRGDEIATLVGFLAIAYRMQPRVIAILGARTGLRGLEASVAEVEAVLTSQPLPARDALPYSGLRERISFERVTVRYPNATEPALQNVSCSFRRGEVTAVAGHSGAGKSTLVSVLLRFLEPEEGRVLVDGSPLSALDRARWHERLAFVEQNAFLFNATVRENILYGALDADDAALREAARLAQADGFIRALPQGYDTMIGDTGVRLSQGQRQRIALARAFLRRPDMLILDEATNALDAPTEAAMRAAMAPQGASRLVIIIAHRRSTIEHADHVIVLERGRMVEQGRPAELARAGGVFSELYVLPEIRSQTS